MNPERIEADFYERTTIYGYRCNSCGYILDES